MTEAENLEEIIVSYIENTDKITVDEIVAILERLKFRLLFSQNMYLFNVIDEDEAE